MSGEIYDLLSFMGLLLGIWIIYFIAYSIRKNYITISIVFILSMIPTIAKFFYNPELRRLSEITHREYTIPKENYINGIGIIIANTVVYAIFYGMVKNKKQAKLNSGNTINKDQAEENQNTNK